MNSGTKVLVVMGYNDGAGGISNYFNVLGLDNLSDIDYFIIYRKRVKGLQKLTGLVTALTAFYRTITQYEVVHLNVSMNPKSFFRDAVFAWITKHRQIKLVVFWHGWDQKLETRVSNNRLLKTLFMRSFARSDGMITLSDTFSNKLKVLGAKTPLHRYFLTTPPVETNTDIDRIIAAKLAPEYKPQLTFLFISRLERSKGIFIVLEAFNALQKQTPVELKLHIAGEGGDLEHARNYTVEANMQNVIFHGHVSGRKKHEILLESDFLFFPTCYPEGLPTVILEGMYYGLIIVTRSVAGIPEHVINGVNGFITDSTSPGLFSDRILELINDSTLCNKIAITNHNQAREHYSKATVTRTLQTIYSEV